MLNAYIFYIWLFSKWRLHYESDNHDDIFLYTDNSVFYAVLSAVTDILDESLIYIILCSVLLYHLYDNYCIFSTAVLHLCYFLQLTVNNTTAVNLSEIRITTVFILSSMETAQLWPAGLIQSRSKIFH